MCGVKCHELIKTSPPIPAPSISEHFDAVWPLLLINFTVCNVAMVETSK